MRVLLIPLYYGIVISGNLEEHRDAQLMPDVVPMTSDETKNEITCGVGLYTHTELCTVHTAHCLSVISLFNSNRYIERRGMVTCGGCSLIYSTSSLNILPVGDGIDFYELTLLFYCNTVYRADGNCVKLCGGTSESVDKHARSLG